MNKKEKQEEISRVLPLIWNSYQHMYDVRVNSVNDSRNFLLIVLSFILVTSISLFFKFDNILFLFPWILQLIALVILFKTFFINTVVHWFEDKSTLEDIENMEFNRNLFATLKAVENWTHSYQKETGKIIENSLILIFISIYSMLIIFANIYFNSFLIYSLITIFALILFNYYKKQSKSEFTNDYDKFVKRFSNWFI